MKEEKLLKRNQTEVFLAKHREELKALEYMKKNTESTFQMLRKTLEDKKRQVDLIKNPRAYITEAPKSFLASEKLASSKKKDSISPVKIRTRSIDSPIKKQSRSSSRNK